MITLITGAPGSGKSAAMLQMMVEAVKTRPLFVNGIPDLALPHVELEDVGKWVTDVPDGALIVIDEVQRVWRPAGAGQRLPESIAALETHRHRGVDFIIVTQHPKLIHSNVRNLVGRHVHIRDLGIMGRRWYEWPEAADPAQHRSAPHSRKYRLPKSVFRLYKSASLHVKPVREIPRAMWVLGACVLLLGVAGWRIFGSVGGKLTDAKTQAEAVKVPTATRAASAPVEGAQARAAQPTGPATPPPAASAPQVAGCISTAKLCKCISRDGFPMVVDWEVCRVSAASYAGIVPLSVAGVTQTAQERITAAPQGVGHPAPPSSPTPAVLSVSGEWRDNIGRPAIASVLAH